MPKGGFLFFSPWLLHRRAKSFADAEGFRPERFIAGEKIEKGAYLPFITGPRKCIGDGYALMQSALVIATVMQRARFVPASADPLQPEPLITLRPKGGFWVKVSAP